MQHEYGQYRGTSDEEEQYMNTAGQKLDADGDEQFADLLARKIKQELRSEVRLPESPSTGQRLALAIVSLCLLVPLLGLLILALALGLGNTGVGWGFIAVCVVMIVVNVQFNKVGAPDVSAPGSAGRRATSRR